MYATKDKNKRIDKSVNKYIEIEMKNKLDKYTTYLKFAEKVETVKESYFTKQVTSDEEILDEDTTDNTVEISDSMDKYVQAIRKTVK